MVTKYIFSRSLIKTALVKATEIVGRTKGRKSIGARLGWSEFLIGGCKVETG